MLQPLNPECLKLSLDNPVQLYEGVSAEDILQTHPQGLKLGVVTKVCEVVPLINRLLLEL